jgi:tRNA-Thr(GGU) m(6)t(6)A37 methyltransferase TsaA
MSIELEPIGFVRVEAEDVPRSWRRSELEGTLVIDESYLEGLADIEPGQRIVVIFNFHRSPEFSAELLRQTPPHTGKKTGIFSICSPVRPNPIGMSVLEVLGVEGATVRVKGLDMLDGTPVLDIKPYIADERDRTG